MEPPFTPADVRRIAEAGRVTRDPACHVRDHGYSLADVVLALRHCFRVQPDPRPHAASSAPAFRADCHFFRGSRLRVDFNLAYTAGGEAILVVTAFPLGGPA